MDNNIAGTVISPFAGISAKKDTLLFVLYNDFFRRKLLDIEHFTLNNVPAGITVRQVTYINASTCKLTLSSSAEGDNDLTVTVAEEAVNYWLDITSSNLAGQMPGTYNLEKKTENIIPHNLKAGIYFLVLMIKGEPVVKIMVVI